MDKEKTYKETPKQKKSASGISAWIFWILLAFAVIAVFVGAFGNTIWYALKTMSTEATPESIIRGGMPAPIEKYGNKDNNMVKNGMAHKGE